MTENNYNDIINLPHHVSDKRPRMSMQDRAAQFASFAALTGFEDDVDETARITDKKILKDESELAKLNEVIMLLEENISDKPEVNITHFVQDVLKDGGKYITSSGKLKKIDKYEHMLVLEKENDEPNVLQYIAIDDVIDITTPFLKDYCIEI